MLSPICSTLGCAGRPPVKLFDGRPKLRSDAHVAVVDIDVGNVDLQQCADAVIRLRAEYLYSTGQWDDICFHFTSGDPASWRDWLEGERLRVEGRNVTWKRSAGADSSYRSFRRYLDTVFIYARTLSLAKELIPVEDISDIHIGDVFVQGGSPGHAMIVMDVAENADGSRLFLLAQSYMPAQEIHVVRNPTSNLSPWYTATRGKAIITPEWTFASQQLRRFSTGCVCTPIARRIAP